MDVLDNLWPVILQYGTPCPRAIGHQGGAIWQLATANFQLILTIQMLKHGQKEVVTSTVVCFNVYLKASHMYR